MTLNMVDYVILGMIALSIITGLFRGFVKEIIALSVWILAIWFGITYADQLAPWIRPYVSDKTAVFAGGFVVILLATLIVGGIISGMFGFLLRRSGLSGTDRLLGMGFGFIRGVFMISLIILVINMTSFAKDRLVIQSSLYPCFKPVVNWMNGFMPTFIKKVGFLDPDNKDKSQKAS